MPRRSNLTRGHLTRKQHDKMLAMPNFRVLRELQRKKKYIPNFQLGGEPMWPVSAAALQASPSNRTYQLSAPRASLEHVIKSRQIVERMKQKRPIVPTIIPSPVHYVRPAALKAKTSARINILSVPKKKIMLSQIQQYGKDFKDRPERNVDQYPTLPPSISGTCIDFHAESHQLLEKKFPEKYYTFKPVRQIESSEDWKKHRLWLEKRASPKTVFEPQPLPERVSRPISAFEGRLEELAKPKLLYEAPPDEEELFKVPESALNYTPTPRMLELATPKKVYREEVPHLTYSGVNPAALTATASARIQKLATPVERKQNQEELNEDAFKVNPKALVAKTTKRIEQLARPIERK